MKGCPPNYARHLSPMLDPTQITIIINIIICLSLINGTLDFIDFIIIFLFIVIINVNYCFSSFFL